MKLEASLSERLIEISNLNTTIEALSKEINNIRNNASQIEDSKKQLKNAQSNSSEVKKYLNDIRQILNKSKVVCNILHPLLKERENDFAQKLEVINALIDLKKSLSIDNKKEIKIILHENTEVFPFLEGFLKNDSIILNVRDSLIKVIDSKVSKFDKYREFLRSINQFSENYQQAESEINIYDLKYPFLE